MKEAIFVVPQITELVNNKQFDDQLNKVERVLWQSSNPVAKIVLGNKKATVK
jgi:nitrogen fixation-related uncharacterized protein